MKRWNINIPFFFIIRIFHQLYTMIYGFTTFDINAQVVCNKSISCLIIIPFHIFPWNSVKHKNLLFYAYFSSSCAYCIVETLIRNQHFGCIVRMPRMPCQLELE